MTLKTLPMTQCSRYVKQSGGVKKFLYTGTSKETAEEEQWSFSTKSRDSKPSVPVDLNDVWSIQKNVSLGGLSHASTDRLNHNVNKGFYSRHGAMKGDAKHAKPPEKADVGSAWAPGRGSGLSYSYTTNSTDSNHANLKVPSQGGRVISSPRRLDRKDF